MPLEKAQIINTHTNEQIPVLVNPVEYSLDKANTFAEIGIPGLAAPPIQYVAGNVRTLKMELLFDTYEDKRDKDVRRFTRRITDLLEKNPQTKAPPILIFSWGKFSFKCVLDSVGQRFTMFISDGTPVRASLTVSFKEFEAVEIEINRGLFVGVPTAVTLLEGQTLSKLAEIYLGNSALWRAIARRNNITDPRKIPSGTRLVIPTKEELLKSG